MKQFFISYNKADKTWAEWIAWELDAAGFSTVIQAWDFRPGSNFVLDMQRAAAECERTIAVLSPDYLTSHFTQPEWAAAFAKDPTGEQKLLLPVRVKPCDLAGLLPQMVFIDLVDQTEADAQRLLLTGLETGRVKPATKPNPFGVGGVAKAISEKPRFPGSLPPVWNVPHERNRNFTGRDELLQRLREALTSRRSAALVQDGKGTTQALHGLGGIGKTQMAVEYAYRHVDDYDFVWWVRAEENATRDGDLAALAKALGLPEQDKQDQRIILEAVRKWLREHERWLLVLDNVPHPSDLDGVLPQQPLGHIIITSRDPNWHDRATPLKVEVFDRSVSVEFLLRRAGHEFVVPPLGGPDRLKAELRTANQLAAELGDLPLALAQAVGYLEETQLPIGQYLELFQKRRGDLWGDEHAPLGHQQTVAITFGLSIERLPDPAAADLLHLCAFLAPDDIPRWLLAQGGKHLPARLAAAVSDELKLSRLLKLLRSYSLIELTDDSFSVHRLVQAVCHDRINQPNLWHRLLKFLRLSKVSATQKFAAAALKLVNTFVPEEVQTNVAAWPVLQTLLPHARSVATHAERLGIEPESTSRLLDQIGSYLQIRAEFTEAKSVHERAVRLSEKAFGPDHPEVAIRVNNLGTVLSALGDQSGARQAFERALQIDEKTFGPEHPRVAVRVNNLGRVLQDLGDLVGAKQAFERALQIGEKAFGPDHPHVAIRVNNLGGVLWDLGDLPGARQAVERALQIDEKTFGPDHPKVALRLNNLGYVLKDLGDLPGARQALERAFGIFRKFLGDEHPNTRTAQTHLEAVNKLLRDQETDGK